MAQYINIDTDDVLDQVTNITIDSTIYVFRLRYNDRSGWQLSIYDYDTYDIEASDNEDAKLYGERKLMPFQNFFKYTHGVDTLPTGYLYLYDTDDPDIADIEMPTRYNLGQDKQFVLIYYTEDEYNEYNT